jgi:plasmid stabilization system protein ParE
MRIFPVSNYLVLFRALEDGVKIVRVVDGRRDLSGLV